MAYRSLIKNQVRKVFKDIKDLAIDVTLINKTISEFNFNTLETVAGTQTTLVTKGVVINTFKDAQKKQQATTLLLNAEDISNPDSYDKVIISGETWTIVPPFDNNGYTISVEIIRSA